MELQARDETKIIKWITIDSNEKKKEFIHWKQFKCQKMCLEFKVKLENFFGLTLS